MVIEAPELNGSIDVLRDEARRIELATGCPVAPLSFAQEQVWFLQRCEEDSPFYNLAFAHYLSGPLDVDALRRAYTKVIARHPAFGTRFVEVDGRPWQLAGVPPSARLEVEDLSGVALGKRQDLVDTTVADVSRTPFDLEHGPLFRARLVRLDAANHVLVLVAHHLIADGWSVGIVYDELSVTYEALRVGGLATLDLPATDPHSEAWRQRERWFSGLMSSSVERAVDLLTGAPRVELPTTKPRPPDFSYRGRRLARSLGSRLSGELAQLARAEHTTPFMVFVALYAVLLHRYTGETDIVFGVPTSGRPMRAMHDVVGFFANTVAIRIDLSGSPAFREVLARARRATLQAAAAQDTPFEKVVDGLRVERDPARNAIFQNMLIMLNVPTTELRIPSLSVRPLLTDTGTARFDLTLDVRSTEDGFTVLADYSTDLFDEWFVERIVECFTRLARSASADSGSSIDTLAMSGDDDRALLAKVNDTHRDFHCPLAIPTLVEAQVARTPDRLAVSDTAGTALSYLEVDKRANQLASWLVERGAAPGGVVALELNRSAAIVPAAIGVWKTGAGFVFIDPEAPTAHRTHIIEDTNPCAIVDESVLGEAFAVMPESRVDVDIQDDTLAYVYYTSGSSGKPKGVKGHHAGIANRILWMNDAYSVTEQDVSLVLAPLTFDVSLWEMLATLVTGGRVFVADSDVVRDPAAIVGAIADQGVTIAEFVPVMLEYCLAHPEFRYCSSLTRVLCGSETMPADLPRRFYEQRPGAVLYNVFGPTEASIDSLCWRCEADHGTTTPVPIGRPIANTWIRVLDVNGNLAGIGIPGELCIGGRGVTFGYLNLPEITQSRYVPDSESGAMMYRTGDRVWLRPDGALDFLGRLDRQVKINGMRIEPAEVEAALLSHSAVRSCAVYVSGDGSGTRQLEATAETRTDVAPQELQAHLRQTLPRYMVPARLFVVDSMPRNRNGKIDLEAVRAEAVARGPCTNRVETFVDAAVGGALGTLARIWSEVLGCEELGTSHNFFEVGGDSILILQVVARARREQLEVTPKMCYQHQTLGELAGAVEAVAQAPAATIEELTVGSLVPLTPIEGWFFDSGFSEVDYFNDTAYLELRPGVDVDRLLESFQIVFSFHDAFRLRFQNSGGTWVQRYGEAVQVPFARVDLTAVPVASRAEQRQEWFNQAHRAVRLGTGPLAAGVCFLESGSRPRVFVTVHHLAVDAVSWRILLEDVQDVYRSLRAGREPDLVGSASFGHWAQEVSTCAERLDLEPDLKFWRGQAGTELPNDSIRGANLVGSTKVIRRTLPAHWTRRLLSGSVPALGAKFDEVLVSVAVDSVLTWTGGSELGIELEGHGREDIGVPLDTSRTVGWFTSLYPLRLVLDEQARRGVDHRVAEVRDQLAAVPRRGLSYGLLRYCSGTDIRSVLQNVRSPQFHFNYAGQFDNLFGRDALFSMLPDESRWLQAPGEVRHSLIEVNAFVLEGCLHSDWTYSEARHDGETIGQLGDHFLRSLVDVARETSTTGY